MRLNPRPLLLVGLSAEAADLVARLPDSRVARATELSLPSR
jgi:hypothetical protein